MKFSELLIALGIDPQTIMGGIDPELTGVAPLKSATPQDLSFLENKQFFHQLATTHAGALFLPEDDRVLAVIETMMHPVAYVLTPQPRLLFAQSIDLLHPLAPAPRGIHATAVIEAGVIVPESAFVGPHVVVGRGTKLGAGVQIHSNCTIYDQVSIGDRTIIYANAVIHPYTEIGQDCVIHSGAVIGGEGFGFVPDRAGNWTKMRQIGKVILEDQVEIGANACIDRGSIGETRIGQGTKIDNLVQIAHGCSTGKSCAMAAQVGLSGGASVGNNVILGGQVGLANHIHIGDRVMVAAQSGILDDLPADVRVMGYPAFPVKDFFKSTVVFRKLPELQKAIKQLQKKLDCDNQETQ